MPTTHTVEQPAELLPFLFSSLPDVKRTKVRQWLKFGLIQVNGQSITRFDHSLEVGDVVSILEKGDPRADNRSPSAVTVVFEDESIIVIEKPHKLLSVASPRETKKTAYAYLLDYLRGGDSRSSERLFVVHRLDRETSGLMVFAKDEESQENLRSRWDEAKKRYLALTEGYPPEKHGVFSSHLDESGTYRVFSVPESEGTRHAVTHYRVLKHIPNGTLVELTLETGRRNQIRVHLADAGCPIVGDRKYGARKDPARRLALHASSLEFPHPITGEMLVFQSLLPPYLSRLL